MARKKKGDIKSKRGTSLIPGTGSGMAGDKAPSGRPNSSIDAGTVVEKGFGRGQYATERLLHPSIIGKKKNRSKGKTFTPVEMERFEELQGYASDEKKKNPNSKTKTPLEIINDVYKENLERSGSEIVAKAKAKDEARKMKFDTDTLDFKKDSVVLKSPIIDLEAYTVPDIKPIVAGSRVDIKDTSARKRRADISDKTKRSIEIEKRTRALQEEVDKDKLSGMTTIPSASGAGSLILPPRPVPPTATPIPTSGASAYTLVDKSKAKQAEERMTAKALSERKFIAESGAVGVVTGRTKEELERSKRPPLSYDTELLTSGGAVNIPMVTFDKKQLSEKEQKALDRVILGQPEVIRTIYRDEKKVPKTVWDTFARGQHFSLREIGGLHVTEEPYTIGGRDIPGTSRRVASDRVPVAVGRQQMMVSPELREEVQKELKKTGELSKELQSKIKAETKEGTARETGGAKEEIEKELKETKLLGYVEGARKEGEGLTFAERKRLSEADAIRGKGRLDEATGKIGKSAGYDTAAIEMQKRASEREAMRAKRDLTLPELKRERENSKIALTNMEAKYNDLKALGIPPGEAGNTRRALLKEMQKGMKEELENMSDLESKIGRAQTTSLGLAPASGVVDEISDQERAQLEAGRSQAMQTLVRQLTLYRDQAKASKILESSLQKEYKKKPKNGYPPAAIIHGYEKRLPKGYWKLRIKTDQHRDYIDVYFDIVAPTRQQVTDEQGNVTGWKSPYASRSEQDIDVNKMLELMNMARYPGAEIEDVYSPKIKGKFMQLKWKIKAVKTEG